ncbi:glutamate-cysteine ligase family protein [Longispora albida]|uniref:glutamate-cysteine ligase family protein n=1 Tax=Longispora albida TaxID=203523 RepID=UPI00037B0BD1|nr:glutamate-cysteine ligase family protein [Longispora albida]
MSAVLLESMLSEKEAMAYVASAGFRAGPVGSVGAELEWIVRDPQDPLSRPHPARLREAVAGLPDPLPGGGRITIEPGGQLELSSGVSGSLAECVSAVQSDMALLTAAVEAAGLRLEGGGLDMLRPAYRVLDTPRYVALERFNDRQGPEGRVVACNSASVQVCLDAGDDTDSWSGYRRRWWLSDAMGPMLLAAFANSPGTAGGHRWRSTRQVLRFAMDSSRTRAPRLTDDPGKEWARYALAAKVAVVASPEADAETADWTAPEGLTMRAWLRGAGPRPVTYTDLELHLGTLVPPVRPRGYLEFRMIDQQDGENWIVPVALVTALLDDPVAAEQAAALVAPLRSLRRHHDWVTAARRGLREPALAEAAYGCFQIALRALDRMGAPGPIVDAVAAFAARYPAQGRCPADDVAARRVRTAVAA